MTKNKSIKSWILGFFAFTFLLGEHSHCKTIRIERISELDRVQFEKGDTFLVNPDISEEQSVENQEISAEKIKSFLEDKKFERFVLDIESQVYYYELSIDHSPEYLSLIERLGPQVETKLRSLIKNYQKISGRGLPLPRS